MWDVYPAVVVSVSETDVAVLGYADIFAGVAVRRCVACAIPASVGLLRAAV